MTMNSNTTNVTMLKKKEVYYLVQLN